MNTWFGPLAEGRRFLILAVLVGVVIAGGVWILGNALGLNLSPDLKPYLTVGGIVVGVVVVYIAHTI